MHCLKSAAVVGLSLIATCVLSHHAGAGLVFNDGDFSSWTSTYASNGASTHAFAVNPTGGNPGAMISSIQTRQDGAQLEATMIKNDLTAISAMSGGYTFSFQYRIDPSATSGFLGIHMAIEQNGERFYDQGSQFIITGNGTWQTASVNSTLSAGNFVPALGSSGTVNLSGAVPTKFGLFIFLNGPSSGVWGDNFDNVMLTTVNPVTTNVAAVPEGGAWLLMGSVGLGATVVRRLSRKKKTTTVR